MHLFVTSSPYIDGADRAILSNANDFVDRIRAVLPPNPNVVFVCSDPDDHGGVCRFAAETCAAFLEAGIPFVSFCRALICQPDFVLRMKKGEQEESGCLACNGCYKVYRQRPMRCVQHDAPVEQLQKVFFD